MTKISYNNGRAKFEPAASVTQVQMKGTGIFMIKKLLIVIMVLTALIFTSCNPFTKKKNLLDQDKPITISVWNYYNGSVKEKFDSLVTEFNETVGAKKGVVVEAQSYGDVNELAESVYNSANKSMGALPMPHIFASYPDNAFRIDQISELVNLEHYFSKEELSEIRPEFLEEGRFGEKQELKILPIAKSTEVLFLNKTDWDSFAAKSEASLEDLSTWEGLIEIAKKYYDQTGKAFFSIDANANYMLISSMQIGSELYHYIGDNAEFNLNKENARRIWKNYYVPYLQGYFMKTGRFSSDDEKTGTVIAYTGSTAGASYFPIEVAKEDEAIPIEGITLPYPYYEGGKPYAMQQGAGMCIAKSDEAHEYASSLFLKWFIDLPQNVQFAVSTAYLPVKSEALKTEAILKEANNMGVTNQAVQNSITTAINMFQTYTLYGSKPFTGSYDMRSLLENHLLQHSKDGLEQLSKRVQKGEKKADVLKELSSEASFEEWYKKLIDSVNKTLKK